MKVRKISPTWDGASNVYLWRNYVVVVRIVNHRLITTDETNNKSRWHRFFFQKEKQQRNAEQFKKGK